jgi:polar amino acid transport system ATP-binding protein
MVDIWNDVSSTVIERQPAATKPMLVMDQVAKRFGSLEVLRGISLSVPRRGGGGNRPERIGTTLLRCINLLEDYEHGLVAIDGEPTLKRF